MKLVFDIETQQMELQRSNGQLHEFDAGDELKQQLTSVARTMEATIVDADPMESLQQAHDTVDSYIAFDDNGEPIPIEASEQANFYDAVLGLICAVKGVLNERV